MPNASSRWQVLPYWRSIAVVGLPLVLLPLPLVSATPEARCGYVMLLLAGFWMTEAVPLAITALLPVVLFPLVGIMSTSELCTVYLQESNMMFLGGLTVAIAVEHCNLHKRVALFVLLRVGCSPRRLLAGFMITTMFLSMWISNTAATAMMVPIIDSILDELFKSRSRSPTVATLDVPDMEQLPGSVANSNNASRRQSTISWKPVSSESRQSNGVIVPLATQTKEQIAASGSAKPMRRALMLAVAYSANIGGTGVVTGTPTNLILMSTLQENYDEPTGLTFASWMGFNIPGMLICVFLSWVWLQIMFFGWRGQKLGHTTDEQQAAVKQVIQRNYRSLGAISFHEAVVSTLFLCLVFLWVFRSPEFVKGWAHYFILAFGDIVVADATPVMLIVFLLFVIPKKLDFWCFRDPNDPEPVQSSEACLTWKVVNDKLPWGVVLLLGGGFAIGAAVEHSGLSSWLGTQLTALEGMPVEAIVFVLCFMTAMVTEVVSNTATASILMPILKELSVSIHVNPLYLMLPVCVCCSYAFMLPVATAPNAIVFPAARMKTVQMMKTGIMMNVLCVCTMTLMINTLGVAMFDVKTFPDWANVTHSGG